MTWTRGSDAACGACDDAPAADRCSGSRRSSLAVARRSTSSAASCCRSWPGSCSPICSIPLADRLQRLGLPARRDAPDPGRCSCSLFVLALRAARAAAGAPARRASSTGCRTMSTELQALHRRARARRCIERLGGRRARSPTCRAPSAISSARARPGSAASCSRCGRAGRRCIGVFVAARRHAGGRLLHAGRLGPHGRHGRRLGAAAPSRHRARARPRDQQARSPASSAARRWSASSSAPATRSALSLIGLNFGVLIGMIGGLPQLHPLCRLADRARAVGRAWRSCSSGRTGR